MVELSELDQSRRIKGAFPYDQLFAEDYTDYTRFPHRVLPEGASSSSNERFFEIPVQQHLVKTWRAHQERSIEWIAYYPQTDEKSLSPSPIVELKYEGWRRHVEERRSKEGGRIIFRVPDLHKQSKLARMIDDDDFQSMGWMEPVVAVTEDPMLALNYIEESVANNPDYIDNLFRKIYSIAPIPSEVISDLKSVIALNSVERFIQRMLECGFSDYEYEEAMKLIRPTLLKGVASPFYVAALFCKKHKQWIKARKLLRKVSKNHWQYDIAHDLERSLYEEEMREMDAKHKAEVEALINQAGHLRNQTHPAASAHALSPEAKTKANATNSTPHSSASKNANVLPRIPEQVINRLAEVPFGKEIIPHFQALSSSSERHASTKNAPPPNKATPKSAFKKI